MDNRIIAEFMDKAPTGFYDTLDKAYKEMQYHKSWDWLMSVVEKIEKLGFVVIISTSVISNRWGQVHYCHIERLNHFEARYCKSISGHTKIEVTYEAVTEFIKWYNKNV